MTRTYDPSEWLYHRFHHRRSRRIEEWSELADEVVIPYEPSRPYRGPTIIKRVDLIKVQVPEDGLTDEKKREAQKEQVAKEIDNLRTAELFVCSQKVVEKRRNDLDRIYIYIEMHKPGSPLSRSGTSGWVTEARNNGIKGFERKFKLRLDEKHSTDNKYFAVVFHAPPSAIPMMLRYAKTIE
ncbi:hypothetical protein APHAL10511_001430 [Amanita phalloides]|nr:hypothetical protein APHAL10511_001430 [Amanita phalloides]